MNKYTSILEEMTVNFAFPQFVSLLKEIDNEIVKGNIQYFDPKFIYYFKQITEMVNDRYIVDGKLGTLGHMLVENALLSKERLTPTLAMCFFLEQKQSLGLDNACNEINFVHLNGGNYNMQITHYSDTGLSNVSFNWKYYENLQSNVDDFNYELMWTMSHELTHVYQLTRTEETENVFDKLVCLDYKKDSILIANGGVNSNKYFHQALLSEFMADEQAHVFMLQLAQAHPEYFNDELIQQKKNFYQMRKNGTYGDYGSNPREAFSELVSDIKYTYETNKDEQEFAFIPPMLSEIDQLNKKSQPLITQLQMQGISEKSCDSYYSIYLKSLYQFDGNGIILNNDLQNKSSKGI